MKKKHNLKTVRLTPAMATKLLEANKLNRPLSQAHVDRIAKQITEGKWRFNGDTIKIAVNDDVLDGQHRLWACILADMPIETAIIDGIEREAFSTIDTIRKPRSGADILSLCGLDRHRKTVASALAWLLRWQRNAFPKIRAPKNRIENSDIEAAYEAHPAMAEAAERTRRLKGVISISIATFLYYVFSNKNQELADKFVDTLENPAGMSVSHPFFQYRTWLLQSNEQPSRADSVLVVAYAIKAWNAARKGHKPKNIYWRGQGPSAEPFPTIE
ncbi:MAG TPA: hypothetical protein ENH89_00055 [Aurantimonas coralicida]|nr:hypothetical protein [Aurantimonas coralicida]